MRRTLFFLGLWALWRGVGATPFVATVVTVLDGDTVTVVQGHKTTTVRLAGIDAPEKLQEYGSASRDALAALVLRKEVQVSPRAVDDYGRVIAVLHAGRVNVNEDQLRRGMAWEYSQYHGDKALVALQAEARRARRGLWAGVHPQPPWIFRKSHADSRDGEGVAGACGKKQHCAQMVTCAEARFYLIQCRIRTLDKDGDGVPCEALCNAKAR